MQESIANIEFQLEGAVKLKGREQGSKVMYVRFGSSLFTAIEGFVE
jgi:hypothetical protein